MAQSIATGKRKHNCDRASNGHHAHAPPPPPPPPMIAIAPHYPQYQTGSSQPQSQLHALLAEGSPRLDYIPSRIEDIVKLITLGGCPQCGCFECIKKGKVGGGSIQKYVCKECNKKFHESSVISKNEGTYVDRTMEGKERVQALFQYGYGEAIQREMAEDKLNFQRRVQVLQEQLREKRRNISKLLDLHFLIDEDEKDPSTISKHVQEKKKVGKIEQQHANPLRSTILLLRKEMAPKLEQTVARLLSERDKLRHEGLMQNIILEEEQIIDVVTTAQATCIASSEGGNNGRYELASRMLQDGGEEIEIFEKYSDEDGNE